MTFGFKKGENMAVEIKKRNPEVSNADLLNMVRANASAEYKRRVPEALQPGQDGSVQVLNTIGRALYTWAPLRNYFYPAFYNLIGVQIGKNKIYDNQLRMFKIGLVQEGEGISEYFVDTTKAHNYSPDTAYQTWMKREKSDIYSAFHHMNFQKFYKDTISKQNLKLAFLSWEALDNLIEKINQSLWTTSNWHEYLIMKHMLGRAMLNGVMAPIEAPAFTWENTKKVTALIRQTSNDMEQMSRTRNQARVNNFTDKERQVVVLNTASESIIDVEVMAAAFNKPYVDFLAWNRVTLTAFTMEEEEELLKLFEEDNYNADFLPFTQEEINQLNSVPGAIISKDWFVVADNLLEWNSTPFNNEGLYYNNTLHKWSTFSISPFEEAVVFTPGTPSVTRVAIIPEAMTAPPSATVHFEAKVETQNFASKVVTWESDNENVIVAQDGTVTIGKNATGTANITITSVFDPTKTATAVLTIA